MSNKLPQWKYRRKIKVQQSNDGTQTNYQLPLMVNRIDPTVGKNCYKSIFKNNFPSYYIPNHYSSYCYNDLTSVTDYIIQSGDYIQYDVYWTSGSSYISFDYLTSDGISSLQKPVIYDQHGLSMSPSQDLASYAINTWFSRKAAIDSSHVGKTITQFNIAVYLNYAGVLRSKYSTGYIRNIRITDSSNNLRKQILIGSESSMSVNNVKYGIYSGQESTFGDFTLLNSFGIESLAAHPNGDIYATATTGIYKQSAGTTGFTSIDSTTNWRCICVSELTGNVYATKWGGQIYVKVNGSSSFVAMSASTTQNWQGIACDPINGGLYAAVSGGKIWWQQHENSGSSFQELTSGSTSQSWYEICVGYDGIIWVGTGSYQWKATVTTDSSGPVFTQVTTGPSGSWNTQKISPNGDMFAIIQSTGIYIKQSGSNTFSLLNYPLTTVLGTSCVAITVAPNWDIYVGTSSGIYKSKVNGSKFSLSSFTKYPPAESSTTLNVTKNKVSSTFKDIRFTKSNGTSLLNYWIEDYDDDGYSFANVWIQFDSIPYTGTTTTNGLYTIRTYNRSGIFQTVKSGSVDVLLVGGGGGAGSGVYNAQWDSGGGGGQVYESTATVNNLPYNVTVGLGGAVKTADNLPGSNGGISVFGIFLVYGGFGGGLNASSVYTQGMGGYSGNNDAGGLKGSYPSGNPGGGGGGSALAGSNGVSTTGGNGGRGALSSITGTSTYYGGGGGGLAVTTNGTPGLGTIGQGGTGGAGSNGIVIIRYLTSDALETPDPYNDQFYIYYGNSGASSLSNIDTTMDAGLRYWYFSSAGDPPTGSNIMIDPITNSSNYKGTDIDLSINHSWTSPAKIIINPSNTWENQNPAQIIWYGWVKNKGIGAHTFYCSSDDGQRLSIPDDNLIIYNWLNQSQTEESYTLSITNTIRIKYQYYANNDNIEMLKLGWTPADGSGKVYPIPSTYLRCNKYTINPPSFSSFLTEEILFSQTILIF